MEVDVEFSGGLDLGDREKYAFLVEFDREQIDKLFSGDNIQKRDATVALYTQLQEAITVMTHYIKDDKFKDDVKEIEEML